MPATVPRTKPEVRNLSFDLSGVPRQWHAAGPAVTAFFNNLSTLFPLGERMFIDAVKAYRDSAGEASLQAEISAFAAQEAIHMREHVRYNDLLRAQGYPVEAMERRLAGLLKMVKRVIPRRWPLAATCALEHFTALMAHIVLEDGSGLDGAHPAMAALWRWHAAEETEHKSVAFDVYRAAGGNYGERVTVMALATLIFLAKVAEQQLRFMRVDGTATSPRQWAALIRFLFVDPGGMRKVTRGYFHYYRPSFHPSDVDSDALVDNWKNGFAHG